VQVGWICQKKWRLRTRQLRKLHQKSAKARNLVFRMIFCVEVNLTSGLERHRSTDLPLQNHRNEDGRSQELRFAALGKRATY